MQDRVHLIRKIQKLGHMQITALYHAVAVIIQMVVKQNLRPVPDRRQIFQKTETVNRMGPEILCLKICHLLDIVLLIEADVMQNAEHRVIHQLLLRVILIGISTLILHHLI